MTRKILLCAECTKKNKIVATNQFLRGASIWRWFVLHLTKMSSWLFPRRVRISGELLCRAGARSGDEKGIFGINYHGVTLRPGAQRAVWHTRRGSGYGPVSPKQSSNYLPACISKLEIAHNNAPPKWWTRRRENWKIKHKWNPAKTRGLLIIISLPELVWERAGGSEIFMGNVIYFSWVMRFCFYDFCLPMDFGAPFGLQGCWICIWWTAINNSKIEICCKNY